MIFVPSNKYEKKEREIEFECGLRKHCSSERRFHRKVTMWRVSSWSALQDLAFNMLTMGLYEVLVS